MDGFDNEQSFRFKGKIWRWDGNAAWHFVTVPSEITEDLNNLFGHLKRGWGSLKVKVTSGTSTWDTSVFPDKKSGTYLLPIKKSIREQEQVTENSEIDITIRVFE